MPKKVMFKKRLTKKQFLKMLTRYDKRGFPVPFEPSPEDKRVMTDGEWYVWKGKNQHGEPVKFAQYGNIRVEAKRWIDIARKIGIYNG